MKQQVVSLIGALVGTAIPLFFTFETIFVPKSMWVPIWKILFSLIPWGILYWHIIQLQKQSKRTASAISKLARMLPGLVKITDPKAEEDFTDAIQDVLELANRPMTAREEKTFEIQMSRKISKN